MDGEDWDETAAEAQLRDMEREWEAQASGSLDYYAVLNVSRQATDEEVRDSYKRMSRRFHPDRHHDSEKRECAQRQFHDIHRAYEVLTDPRSRMAYDQLGEEGLGVSKAVGHKVRSARDLQAAFEREARRRRTEEVEQWTQSKSKITVELDSKRLTSLIIRDALARQGVRHVALSDMVGLGGMFMKHSFSADLATGLSGSLTGQMFSRSKHGSGNVVGTLKYSPGTQSWASISVPALPPYAITLKSMHQPSLETFCSTQVVQHTPSLSTPPSATVTCGRLLFGTTTGTMTMRTGNQYALGSFWAASPTRVPHKPSGVTLGLVGKHGDHNSFSADVTAGVQHSYVTARYTHQIDPHLSITGAAGLQRLGDVSASVEMYAEVDSWTRLQWKVEFGLASGVKATVAMHRLGHTVQLPILLSPLPEPLVAVCATLLPMAAALGLHYAVLRPRRQRFIQQQMADLKEEQRSLLFHQKRRAEEAVRLMAVSVDRSREDARAAGGLVIEMALYGDLPFGIAAQDSNPLHAMLEHANASRRALGSTDESRACDVTLPLQALITNDQLVIAGGASKRSLPGFYDPAFGLPKSLFVRYRFRSRLHEALVKDEEPLAIPLRSHCLAEQ
ncbi:DnaJ-domain-containing protein [Coemansia reversa NRRL 1564]|uniref:DnaJ-domain-containing protein n=1 Tax=Coemansia reversa (strain ATCC 12441 / NRRL 1564) TaxID=763665 RepID=A0A2G5BAX3_COERN|nr:DnaJ-domain-containing protein [Coemansia reversa NRRL 1564]|eukprot:PIA16142.1 DnaJ-domain-containing protein [Coemansia reversa NRRL 1564]